MRKEVILAVIIGILLGGIILYGINLANSSSKINFGDKEATEEGSPATPTTVKQNTSQISLIYPLDNAVVTDSQLTLKGTAKANANIAIVTESDDILTTADSSGNFSSAINLVSGENVITITAVDEKQASSSAQITVIRTNTLPE